jgi:alkylated DNA repair dioxygenase AlkB
MAGDKDPRLLGKNKDNPKSLHLVTDHPHQLDLSTPTWHLLSTINGQKSTLFSERFVSELWSGAEGRDPTAMFQDLLTNIPWVRKNNICNGSTIPMPRSVAFYGPCSYQFSGCSLPATLDSDWPDSLRWMIRNLNAKFGLDLNSVLLNKYADGSESVNWHSDDEVELGPQPTIVSISLGETRTFELRRKLSTSSIAQQPADLLIKLNHGSALVMADFTQAHWQHRIGKTQQKCSPRINLTFRSVHNSVPAVHSPSAIPVPPLGSASGAAPPLRSASTQLPVSVDGDAAGLNLFLTNLRSEFDSKFKELTHYKEASQQMINLLISQMREKDQQIQTLMHSVQALENNVAGLSDEVDDLRSRSLRNNLLVSGIPRSGSDSPDKCRETIEALCSDKLGVQVVVNRAHRVSQRHDAPIVCHVPTDADISKIFANVRKLRGSRVFVDRQYSDLVRWKRNELAIWLSEARKRNLQARLVFDHIFLLGHRINVSRSGTFFVGSQVVRDIDDVMNIRAPNGKSARREPVGSTSAAPGQCSFRHSDFPPLRVQDEVAQNNSRFGVSASQNGQRRTNKTRMKAPNGFGVRNDSARGGDGFYCPPPATRVSGGIGISGSGAVPSCYSVFAQTHVGSIKLPQVSNLEFGSNSSLSSVSQLYADCSYDRGGTVLSNVAAQVQGGSVGVSVKNLSALCVVNGDQASSGGVDEQISVASALTPTLSGVTSMSI